MSKHHLFQCVPQFTVDVNRKRIEVFSQTASKQNWILPQNSDIKLKKLTKIFKQQKRLKKLIFALGIALFCHFNFFLAEIKWAQ